jgi:hypothetical protein
MRDKRIHKSVARVVLSTVGTLGAFLSFGGEAFGDDAIVAVGEPPPPPPPNVDERVVADDRLLAQEPELRRSPFRVTLAPMAITSGKGVGVGVGLGADFGTGSVGGRLSASWLRGEGKTGSGESTPTGDAIGLYSGEITLDLRKKGPLHPVIGMGAGVLHVSRPDGHSGYAGMGTGRFGVEYALGLDDADVRVGTAVIGGVIGPVDDDVKDLRAYALADVHLAIGF